MLTRPSKTVPRVFDLWADDLVRGSLLKKDDCSGVITTFRTIARVRVGTIILLEERLVWLRNHFANQLERYGAFESGLSKEVLPVLAWLDTAKEVDLGTR